MFARGLHFKKPATRQHLSRHCETLKGLAPQGAGAIGHSQLSFEFWKTMPDLNALAAIIEPEAKALGFDLVRIAWLDKGGDGSDEPTLQVMAERPDTRQLVIEDCAALSHRISDRFDELDPIVEAYRLEVSSPGIDRPLTRVKDFADWAGHEAKIEVSEAISDQKRFRGVLGGIDANGDVISITDKSSVVHLIPFSTIHNAKLVLTDRLIASTAPLNSAGVDEIDEDNLEHEQED
jgi:ribosome maturation factor RimP